MISTQNLPIYTSPTWLCSSPIYPVTFKWTSELVAVISLEEKDVEISKIVIGSDAVGFLVVRLAMNGLPVIGDWEGSSDTKSNIEMYCHLSKYELRLPPPNKNSVSVTIIAAGAANPCTNLSFDSDWQYALCPRQNKCY